MVYRSFPILFLWYQLPRAPSKPVVYFSGTDFVKNFPHNYIFPCTGRKKRLYRKTEGQSTKIWFWGKCHDIDRRDRREDQILPQETRAENRRTGVAAPQDRGQRRWQRMNKIRFFILSNGNKKNPRLSAKKATNKADIRRINLLTFHKLYSIIYWLNVRQERETG